MTREMHEVKINLIENIITWQGEGPDCGQRMFLIRFKDCDRVEEQRPCPWCDTLVKMRTSIPTAIDLQTIQETLVFEKCGLMITGGEPLYHTNFQHTLSLLNLNYTVANIETNGCNLIKFVSVASLRKPWKVIFSPKFFNEDEYKHAVSLIDHVLLNKNLDNRVYFKIVAEDNEMVRDMMYKLNSAKVNHRTFVMPQGKNIEELRSNAPLAFDMAEEFKLNFSSREHLIYGFI